MDSEDEQGKDVEGPSDPDTQHDDPSAEVLSIDAILASDDEEFATIPGYKNGEMIRIGSLTAGDLIEWTTANEGPAKDTAGLRLIVRSLVDKQGTRIANDKHIGAFKKKNHKQTERIVKEILKLNGLKVPGIVF